MVAGLVGRAMYAFESVGWFGYFGFPTSARPWQNQILYDWSARCPINIQDNWACGILYAIIGYQVKSLHMSRANVRCLRPRQVYDMKHRHKVDC